MSSDAFCQHPMHDHDRHDERWHRWTDGAGNRFAARCPLSLPSASDEPKPATTKKPTRHVRDADEMFP